MKIIGVVEARNDERFSDRNAFVLLADKPALYHVVERMKECQLVDEVVLDASADGGNKPVVELARELDVTVRRTAEPDVLKRLTSIVRVHGGEAVVVTEGRCPVLNPQLVDAVICHFLSTHADVTSTADPVDANWISSVQIEVIGRKALEKLIAHHRGRRNVERISDAARMGSGLHASYYSDARMMERPDLFLSIDDAEQLETLKAVFERLGRAGAAMDMDELARMLDGIHGHTGGKR